MKPFSLENGSGQQANGASARDEGEVTGLRVRALVGVVADRKRLDERCLVEGNIAHRVHLQAALDDDLHRGFRHRDQPTR